MRIKHYQRGQFVKEWFLMAIIFTLMMWVFASGLMQSVDDTIKIQDKMNCESAKKSGNIEWLDKCDTYYKTGNSEDIKQ